MKRKVRPSTGVANMGAESHFMRVVLVCRFIFYTTLSDCHFKGFLGGGLHYMLGTRAAFGGVV